MVLQPAQAIPQLTAPDGDPALATRVDNSSSSQISTYKPRLPAYFLWRLPGKKGTEGPESAKTAVTRSLTVKPNLLSRRFRECLTGGWPLLGLVHRHAACFSAVVPGLDASCLCCTAAVRSRVGHWRPAELKRRDATCIFVWAPSSGS